jgi:pyruvate,water dikinase
MFSELMSKGVKVPSGFAVTAEAYRYFLREAGLDVKIHTILTGLDTRDVENLRQRGAQTGMPFSPPNCHAISHRRFSPPTTPSRVIRFIPRCRSAEQRDGRGFAGCQCRRPARNLSRCERALAVLDCCKRSFASLFTDRAISYRVRYGHDHFHSRALHRRAKDGDAPAYASSGDMFTLDTETGVRDAVLITRLRSRRKRRPVGDP